MEHKSEFHECSFLQGNTWRGMLPFMATKDISFGVCLSTVLCVFLFKLCKRTKCTLICRTNWLGTMHFTHLLLFFWIFLCRISFLCCHILNSLYPKYCRHRFKEVLHLSCLIYQVDCCSFDFWRLKLLICCRKNIHSGYEGCWSSTTTIFHGRRSV
jgi:hypothetical protein